MTDVGSYDPDVEYVRSQFEKIDRIYAEMEHRLSGRPQSDEGLAGSEPAVKPTLGWQMVPPVPQRSLGAQLYMSLSPNIGPPVDPAARAKHLETVRNARKGTNQAVLTVGTGSVFTNRQTRWLVVLAFTGGMLMFALFVGLVAYMIWRVVHFH